MPRSLRKLLGLAAVVASLACLSACSDDDSSPPSATPTPTPPLGSSAEGKIQICAQAPIDQICSFLPHNVIAPQFNNGYSQLGAKEQRPFDNFSWQSFVALNWPATPDGTPIGNDIGAHPEAPRVWRSYPTALEVYDVDELGGPSHRPSVCDGLGDDLPIFQAIAKSDHLEHAPAEILQATQQPLIDRNLNYVLYDVRMNSVEEAYLEGSNLNTAAGQAEFQMAGGTVSFPQGFYADDSTASGGSVGAIEVKSAWRILDENVDRTDRFYTMRARIYVSDSASESGEGFCFPATLGLVGMHIIQRTSGPQNFGLDWIWSTFEHVDNAPLADEPGDPTSFTAIDTQCAPPPTVTRDYSFYDRQCPSDTCVVNAGPTPQPTVGYLWDTTPPYAKSFATEQTYGTQVVRCWKIYDETQEMNGVYRSRLKGTVWENYRLVNTQWQGGIEDPVNENGNIPRFLGNAVLETYIQGDSSCLQCHSFATTTAGQDANFSFLMGLAH